ncbi:hypothetical protein TRFO_28653 [Tritrichomonas foetus]|uniref:CUB-like domain-containing protein n=1 Tax=Tritrichomonas foetus TaxID=1144522 RepID=A0A1J4JZM5_9EUKA|nr:hypothetical protein TRFO_28653 [Tritrichomonas foetus]|eukprot:OHT03944.1 hypothetical protein TRFO_28653 [Tritrichomonas foetus]
MFFSLFLFCKLSSQASYLICQNGLASCTAADVGITDSSAIGETKQLGADEKIETIVSTVDFTNFEKVYILFGDSPTSLQLPFVGTNEKTIIFYSNKADGPTEITLNYPSSSTTKSAETYYRFGIDLKNIQLSTPSEIHIYSLTITDAASKLVNPEKITLDILKDGGSFYSAYKGATIKEFTYTITSLAESLDKDISIKIGKKLTVDSSEIIEANIEKVTIVGNSQNSASNKLLIANDGEVLPKFTEFKFAQIDSIDVVFDGDSWPSDILCLSHDDPL